MGSGGKGHGGGGHGHGGGGHGHGGGGHGHGGGGHGHGGGGHGGIFASAPIHKHEDAAHAIHNKKIDHGILISEKNNFFQANKHEEEVNSPDIAEKSDGCCIII